MIAIPKPPRRKLTPEHQRQFLGMLPVIRKKARMAFQDLDPEGKEEATAEVIAVAYVMFVGLVQQGREALAYPSVLAMYAVKRVRVGRKAATSLNANDVSSEYCQLRKHLSVERLDRYDGEDQAWRQIVVEDKRTTPAEIAATRIDFQNWLGSLSSRLRKMAVVLATGETTTGAARRFGVSAGRVSQVRKELAESWEMFQGEGVPASTA
jgi:hypothetical protein